jgi:ribonuclease HIII
MIKDEQHIKEIVEQIKATLGIEQLDELERQYNKMYKELKEKEEAKKGVVTKEEW